MKLLLLVALLLVSGCSMLGSGRDIPEVQPVEVVTVVKKAPMYHPPLPNNIDPVPVEWTVLNAELMQEYLKQSTQREERRQRVEQLNTTLYIAKNGKVEMQQTRAANNINFLV